MNRRDLLSYLGCSAITLTLIGKDARPCSTCGSLLHTRHRHEQKHKHSQSGQPVRQSAIVHAGADQTTSDQAEHPSSLTV